MPKAYDRECLEYDILTDTEKARIFEILSWHFESKWYVEMRKDFANINQEGREFVNTRYFPAITAFIQREVQKQEPNLRHLALMSYAAKIIAYDYTLSR